MVTFESVEIGALLPVHLCGPITRTTLALYAGGSGDHNPIHVDIDFAKRHGRDDVFAHGMLSMAYLAQLLMRWVPQEHLRSWQVRFTAITPVNSKVICSAQVVEKFEADGERRVKLQLSAHLESGQKTLTGEAIVALP